MVIYDLNFTIGEQKNVCSLPFHYVIFKFQSSLEYTLGIKTRFIMLIMLSFAQVLHHVCASITLVVI